MGALSPESSGAKPVKSAVSSLDGTSGLDWVGGGLQSPGEVGAHGATGV